MPRNVQDVSLHWSQDRGLTKVSARVDGGKTGTHFVEYDVRTVIPKEQRDEYEGRGIKGLALLGYRCDCFGFKHGTCRHSKVLKMIKYAVDGIADEMYLELNK